MVASAVAAAGIQSAADLAGGILGAQGASSANKVMRRFTKYMSNTAVQRRKEDLLAAGFNPYLAIGDPASSPSVGQMNPAEHIARGVSSAGGAVAKALQLENLKADTSVKTATADSIRQSIPQGARDQNLGDLEWARAQAAARMTASQADQAETIASKLVNELDMSNSEVFIRRNEKVLSDLTLDQAKFVLPKLRAAVERESIKATNDANVQRSAGWLLSWIRSVSEAVINGANSASALRDLMPEMPK